ncbi:assimilatory nitrate reductase (NADH) alpha subunit apoprotein [Georgenia satyanarayanai]|uniref:Assimilatory nitrate reductase (NADH) alpha subunit apoprotein n=1 Tax=Georgenia satyanarayanai TaxID=860221 RepID=A0A2Y9AGU4_9MICO|nr:molybdopterin oxidoreductase family protein [Georgenia satyanarayanai]PYF99779.1 assimilatory nitrate reductase (NADH) alpha subunit apoprotein [Georgenia satyanarayanai]SSA41759.1 assimilatory nitrate reductase (NADH) alpha subunit apoprotein [Georgenia satyanarayanai]
MTTTSLPVTPVGARTAATHCPYCALQCGMSLTAEPGRTVDVTPRQFPTNQGGLCQKGWTSAAVLDAPDRLTTPLLRGGDGELRPASWDDALDVVAGSVTRIQQVHGPDAVAVFGGGGLTNEKAYALGKFARTVLRTANIDYNGRFCMASAAAGANRAFGVDRGLPFPLTDLAGADAVLLLGSNLAETMPPSVQHLAGVRSRGGLVVVDPRRSATAALTGEPDDLPVTGGAGPVGDQGVHLQPVPGTDLVVLLALLHVVVTEGLLDGEYVAARTTGFDDVRRAVAAWWPERAETVCGVPAGRLRHVARVLAAASPARGGAGAYVLTGRGVEQSTQGTATVTAAINLALALGLPGRPGSGYGAITGQGNGQGGREHGQKADQLPGYRKIDDPAARAHVAAVWGVDPASIPGPGRPAVELLRSLGARGAAGTYAEDGRPRALLVHGSNLVVSAPDASRVEANLRALDLLVVCDVVPSETALLADVVLPVTQWAEEEGTMTSLEGRVIRRRQVTEPPGEARSELWVLAELARRLGSTVVFPTEPAAVFDELARASAGGAADYSGLSHARLDADEASGGPGLFWPVPAAGASLSPHPGTPRLFLDRFPTPDGRARMVAVDHVGPSDDVRADAPVYLVTGRVLQHYQSGAQTRRVPELDRSVAAPFVELHPVLGVRLGIADGERVRLTSRRGHVEASARWTDRIRPDTVFMPFHWGSAGSVNRVTTDATDPVSGMPEFKVCAVDVRSVKRADGTEVVA